MTGVLDIPPEGVAMIRAAALDVRERRATSEDGPVPYWDVLHEVACKMLGRPPIYMRNPFTGAIFWMEGMDNLTREEFEAIEAGHA